MSQAGVGMVVEKLLTDENLRIRLALDRLETVARDIVRRNLRFEVDNG